MAAYDACARAASVFVEALSCGCGTTASAQQAAAKTAVVHRLQFPPPPVRVTANLAPADAPPAAPPALSAGASGLARHPTTRRTARLRARPRRRDRCGGVRRRGARSASALIG